MFRLMRLPILVWTIFWFGAFVPSHERGAVPLERPAGDCHISEKPASCCASPSGDSSKDTTAERARKASNCAVCFVVALLDAPVAPTTPDLILTVIDRQPVVTTDGKPVTHPITSARPRAPPTPFA